MLSRTSFERTRGEQLTLRRYYKKFQSIRENAMSQFLDKFLKKTLWLWLPFFAFGVLVKELRDRNGK